MDPTSSKEKILKKIRSGLINGSDNPFPRVDMDSNLFRKPEAPLDVTFAENFNAVNGQFIFCKHAQECLDNLRILTEQKRWRHLFCWDTPLQQWLKKADFRKCRIGKQTDKADVGITRCEALIARTGSILLTAQTGGEPELSLLPPIHIVMASTNQLMYSVQDAIQWLNATYQNNWPDTVTFVSGPSRTADIEQELVLGAHGPKDLYVFLMDDMRDITGSQNG